MRILKEEMPMWLGSDLFRFISNVIKQCAESVEGRLNDECEVFLSASERGFVIKVKQILLDISDILKKTPNTPALANRYGDISFRDFYSLLEEKTKSYNLPEEIKKYFDYSWGNKTRIDYGTGHELCFFLFLVSYSWYDRKEIYLRPVFILFEKYIGLIQQIQLKYKLEPAGSRGVWGLDDYQFLSFYFGVSQMIGRSDFPSPKNCFDIFLINDYKDRSLYMRSLYFLTLTKTGDFSRHSPFLCYQTGHTDWRVIRENIFQIYLSSVLGRHQAIQHIDFGEILQSLIK